jgi:hypothetical protein
MSAIPLFHLEIPGVDTTSYRRKIGGSRITGISGPVEVGFAGGEGYE